MEGGDQWFCDEIIKAIHNSKKCDILVKELVQMAQICVTSFIDDP